MIKLLPTSVTNKIAAGEVIERPASVVKELVENAIDAGATEITVEVREGGKSFIKITDNGSGMSKQDLSICLQRHSTSKIKDADDLFNISTLGFRGEALASIAAIADVKIISNQKDEANFIESKSEQITTGVAGAPQGTSIEVRHLFAHQPVRKNYLKSIGEEFQAIQEILLDYATIHPIRFFKLIHNDKTVLVSPSGDKFNTIVSLYGKDIAKTLVPVKSSYEEVNVTGYTSKPYYTRSDKHHIHVYVNKRAVKNQIITKAILDAYHRLLHGGRYPFVIINISIDPGAIDVNVHPQKTEIRIDPEKQVYNAVNFAIQQALQEHDIVPDAPLAQTSINVREDIQPRLKSDYVVEPANQQTLEAPETQTQKLRVLGLAHNCYILAEDKDGVLLVDQHAADERVNYEILLSQYENKGIATQALMQPETLEVNPNDAAAIESNLEELKKFGFIVEPFGPSTFLLRSLPVIVGRQQPKKLIHDIIDELNTVKIPSIETIKDNIIARMACRMSIMKGDTIHHQQATDLIKNLQTCRNPLSCAHGRPTMIRLTGVDLEKNFKRCGHSYQKVDT